MSRHPSALLAGLRASVAIDKAKASRPWFVPVTPGGTPVPYGAHGRVGRVNAAKTREEAIHNLLEDAAHMPYGTWEKFEERGYTIEEWPEDWRP